MTSRAELGRFRPLELWIDYFLNFSGKIINWWRGINSFAYQGINSFAYQGINSFQLNYMNCTCMTHNSEYLGIDPTLITSSEQFPPESSRYGTMKLFFSRMKMNPSRRSHCLFSVFTISLWQTATRSLRCRLPPGSSRRSRPNRPRWGRRPRTRCPTRTPRPPSTREQPI